MKNIYIYTKQTCMKTTLPILLLVCVAIFSNCKKSSDHVTHINCDGLVTDTLGTGDTARIYMQNAFTPNGDGLNDVSRPITTGVAEINYTIYDNSNTVVFTTNSLFDGWSTTIGANTAETYYYKIQVTTNQGHHIGTCGELYKLSCVPSNIQRSNLKFEDQLYQGGGYSPSTMETLPDCP